MSNPRHLLIGMMLSAAVASESVATPLVTSADMPLRALSMQECSQYVLIASGRRSETRKAKRLAKRIGTKNRFRGDESKMSQIPSRILRNRSVDIEGFDRGISDRRRDRHSSVEDLVDALIQAPNARTRKALAAVGLPAFKDVPPIVILHSPVKPSLRDEESLDDLLQ